jgi:single-stranded-DNA-specific exonuclease
MQNHKILKIPSADISFQKELNKELGISQILAQVLINRGISTVKEAEEFLKTKLDHLLDPYSFSDMPKAVDLIKQAIKKKEKILVYGDYDVDGITALTLLKETLTKTGLDVLHYLPHRIQDGYGLTKNILDIARKKHINLLITADCGISNHKEIDDLRKHGIEVIITDHHEPQGSNIPHASSVINPKVKDSSYKFRELAGVGVAYKLCQALTGSNLLDELDLVALGTIADVVPLVGENRIIAKEGLARLPGTKRHGLKALITASGIKNKKFTATHVSFILAPRINASGRMDSAETSFNLLMSKDMAEAEEFASVLEAHNRQRQKVESKIMEEAEDLINREVNFKEHKVIVLAKEDWHQGVLGIVAAKLADRFMRPTIVISLGDVLCKGSGRSIQNFHLFHALKNCQEFLNSFGGHAHAAGLLINKDKIKDFKHSINRLAHEKLKLEDLLPSLDVDMEINFSDLNEKTIAELESLEPFGTGNPEPLFYTRNLRLKGEPQVLGRETLKFWVTDGETTFQAIAFGMSSFKDSLMQAKHFDLVYSPRMDSWNDFESVILEVRDMFFR